MRAAISLCVSPSKYASSTRRAARPAVFRARPSRAPAIASAPPRFRNSPAARRNFRRVRRRPPRRIVPPQPGNRAIARDHQQPAGQRAARRVESRGHAPELEENILQDFLGGLGVAQNPVEDGGEHPGVAVVERGERRFVPLRDSSMSAASEARSSAPICELTRLEAPFSKVRGGRGFRIGARGVRNFFFFFFFFFFKKKKKKIFVAVPRYADAAANRGPTLGLAARSTWLFGDGGTDNPVCVPSNLAFRYHREDCVKPIFSSL